MLESTDSLLKFQVAVSCFAAQRMLGVLPLSGSKPLRSVQELLYETGEAAKKDFRTNTLLFGAFQLGDKAQSAFAELRRDDAEDVEPRLHDGRRVRSRPGIR